MKHGKCKNNDYCKEFLHPTLCKYSIKGDLCPNKKCRFPHIKRKSPTPPPPPSDIREIPNDQNSKKNMDFPITTPSTDPIVLELKKLVESQGKILETLAGKVEKIGMYQRNWW